MNSIPWLVLGLSLPGLALAASPAVPTMPASAVRAGQRAEVRTVFAGDSVETFTAEIVGVLPGGRAEGDLILARATSPRVERTGVAQGMSGSPVYVEGRLIGALSSGWPFSREPVFGITPIAEMLSVLDEPESKETDGTAGPAGVDPVPAARARFRELRWSGDDSSEAAAVPAWTAPVTDPRRAALPLPLAVSGANPAAMAAIRGAFEPSGFAVVPGGRERVTADTRRTLEPGDAVSVDILRGDLNLSALGTVTYRDADRVLLFGHPFFQSGEVRLPLSTARITTVLGNVNTSFKIGTPLVPVGTATQDRRSAVAGRLGPSPKLLPIRTIVRGATPQAQNFTFESVEDRSLLPLLVSTAALNSLLESGGNGVMQTVRWSLDIWRKGRVLRLGDVAAGDNPVAEVANTLAAPVRFLANNPYERFHADSIVVAMDTRPGREQSTLRTVSLARPSVRPGGVAKVRAVLERWRGARETVTIDVPVPDEMPDGRYVLSVSGGLEFDRFVAARLPSRFRVVSVEDAWQRLALTRRSDMLHVGLWARAPEVTSDGEDLPELPNSALAVLASGQQAGDRARRGEWALVQEVQRKFDDVIRGELVLELVVDRLAP